MTDSEPLIQERCFDPFNDRRSRDLRNTLSEKFVEVVLRNDDQEPVKMWRFKRGLPAKWTGPTMNAAQSSAIASPTSSL